MKRLAILGFLVVANISNAAGLVNGTLSPVIGGGSGGGTTTNDVVNIGNTNWVKINHGTATNLNSVGNLNIITNNILFGNLDLVNDLGSYSRFSGNIIGSGANTFHFYNLGAVITWDNSIILGNNFNFDYQDNGTVMLIEHSLIMADGFTNTSGADTVALIGDVMVGDNITMDNEQFAGQPLTNEVVLGNNIIITNTGSGYSFTAGQNVNRWTDHQFRVRYTNGYVFEVGFIVGSFPTNTAAFHSLSNPITTGQFYTNLTTARTTLYVNYTLNDSAISGFPSLAMTNISSGQWFIATNDFALSTHVPGQAVFDMSPNDYFIATNKSSLNASTTINGSFLLIK